MYSIPCKNVDPIIHFAKGNHGVDDRNKKNTHNVKSRRYEVRLLC